MSGGKETPYALKQTCTFQPQVCLSTYDLQLPPGTEGLNANVENVRKRSKLFLALCL